MSLTKRLQEIIRLYIEIVKINQKILIKEYEIERLYRIDMRNKKKSGNVWYKMEYPRLLEYRWRGIPVLLENKRYKKQLLKELVSFSRSSEERELTN